MNDIPPAFLPDRAFLRKIDGAFNIDVPQPLVLALGLLDCLECLITCEGDIIETSTPVGTTLTSLRLEHHLAKRTIVTNNGAQAIELYETPKVNEDHFLGFVQPQASRELPMSGRFTIRAKTGAGASEVVVTTILRCVCCGPAYDDQFSPIGDELI